LRYVTHSCLEGDHLVDEDAQHYRRGMLLTIVTALDVLLHTVQGHEHSLVRLVDYLLTQGLSPCAYPHSLWEVGAIGETKPAGDCAF